MGSDQNNSPPYGKIQDRKPYKQKKAIIRWKLDFQNESNLSLPPALRNKDSNITLLTDNRFNRDVRNLDFKKKAVSMLVLQSTAFMQLYVKLIIANR